MTKQLKMKVVDWWQPDNEENFYNNYIVKKLKDKYDILYSDKPDFLIYSCFGYKHANYDCVRIFYTGENVRPDFNLADYAISFDYTICEDRHLRAPLPFFTQNKSKELQDVLNTRLHFAKNKTKFCGFVASNGYLTQKRNKFFEALCGYKHVDSGGRYKNNIGGNVLCKMSWLQSYKFNICFENSSYPGYLTEKLFDAFISGCIPIYWGDTSLNCTKDNNISQANNFTFNNTSTQNKVMNNSINNINNDDGGGGKYL